MAYPAIIRLLLTLSILSAAALSPVVEAAPTPIPSPPQLALHSYVLMDATTGKILAAHDANTREQPASLTKMLTLYIAFQEIKAGQIHLDDEVTVSKKAWRTGGSRMFLQVGTKVPVKDLIQGIIVQSGNDAAVALAQDVAGSTATFVQMMNQTAARLGMKSSHFADVDGLPVPDHYSTAHDLAILARALIRDFPEYYHYFKEKVYTYNHIKQYNRNRLLWRDPSVDGLKTGHTEEAGYCLVSSAKRGGMRLIAVVMGAKSDDGRTRDNEALLNYGFRFFETRVVYKAGRPITQARVWKGAVQSVPLGVAHDLKVTLPRGQARELRPDIQVHEPILAPVTQGTPYGTVQAAVGKTVLAREPLIALRGVAVGSLWQRLKDDALLYFNND